MYEKNNLFYFVFVLFFILLFTGCRSTMVYDTGERTEEYRNNQTAVRNEQSSIEVTGANIANTSENIARTSNGFTETITSTENELDELGKILQRIRERKISNNSGIE